ncbi:MAG: hypothetical protein CO113_15365 [Elusimicrobia bacterium CG_4_9_14_3_um_filter_62_55]|nr:MAG: hypothetical protein COR54_08600 [Elusimicrobia bacterium CG22_combo_CG10-13_8_21_14_all_63_91]PJA11462.1 MAG: hypothetical protein COX66_19885 [Elusimicrobia bacterium CG_4_10_14_0_2_um_filter_63_34]PJB24151.1 MAG: hypothetical protein CO113_15365 [Elusimicrobia bacterium CG_4_9_14_3_um_filter_62_55]
MDEKAFTVIQCQFEAYNARDLASFLDCYSDDIIIELDGTVVIDSKDGMRASYSKLFSENPDIRCRVASRRSDGDWIIDEEEVSGLVTGETKKATVSYCVQDSRIVKVRLQMRSSKD